MTKDRHEYLLEESANERLSVRDILEIEAAFYSIPVEKLRDLPENALAGDMLEEIGEHAIKEVDA